MVSVSCRAFVPLVIAVIDVIDPPGIHDVLNGDTLWRCVQAGIRVVVGFLPYDEVGFFQIGVHQEVGVNQIQPKDFVGEDARDFGHEVMSVVNQMEAQAGVCNGLRVAGQGVNGDNEGQSLHAVGRGNAQLIIAALGQHPAPVGAANVVGLQRFAIGRGQRQRGVRGLVALLHQNFHALPLHGVENVGSLRVNRVLPRDCTHGELDADGFIVVVWGRGRARGRLGRGRLGGLRLLGGLGQVVARAVQSALRQGNPAGAGEGVVAAVQIDLHPIARAAGNGFRVFVGAERAHDGGLRVGVGVDVGGFQRHQETDARGQWRCEGNLVAIAADLRLIAGLHPAHTEDAAVSGLGDADQSRTTRRRCGRPVRWSCLRACCRRARFGCWGGCR